MAVTASSRISRSVINRVPLRNVNLRAVVVVLAFIHCGGYGTNTSVGDEGSIMCSLSLIFQHPTAGKDAGFTSYYTCDNSAAVIAPGTADKAVMTVS